MIGGDMDKPSNERGSTGPTDGIKAEAMPETNAIFAKRIRL